MNIIFKSLAAFLVIPGALSMLRGGATTITDGGAEDASSGMLTEAVRAHGRALKLGQFWWSGSGPTLEAVVRNPAADNPDDCRAAGSVCGTVVFSSPTQRGSSGLTQVDYSIAGLTEGLHALHVHEAPVDPDCASTGGHWNPDSNNHGGNLDAQRHIGDLGNILADDTGKAEGTLLARVPLRGRRGIEGLAVVVHEGTDDLGLGGDAGSRAVGNAGKRPGCGTILAL